MEDEVKVTPEVVETETPPVDVKPEDTKDETTNSDTKDNKPEEVKEEEVKEPEKEEEPEKQDSDEVVGLKAEIAKLQGELEQAKTSNDSKVALDQANTLLSVQKNLVSEYEGILNGIIDSKLQEIPENLRELLPANISLKERMDWIAKAEKSGLFKVSNPDIEIGKPLNPNNVKQTTDTSKLSASAIMAMAYGNSKSKK